MSKKNQKITEKKQLSLEGMMTLGMTKEGLRTADFVCNDYVEMEAFEGKCKVQMMRDGMMYITELPKRVRNNAIFRDDNSSFSKGQNGRYYFVFTMDEASLEQLPHRLVRQARAIAEKIRAVLIDKEEDEV